jgi:hypothetical protein
MFARDKNNMYAIYRFGKDDKIELEFPEKKKQVGSCLNIRPIIAEEEK